jgi:aromatic-amino-acid transaminase
VSTIVTLPRTSPLIPAAAGRPGDDPIFMLNAEATARAKQGESILNATLGALMEDDGTLAVMPSVLEAISRVPEKRSAGYAPILGDPKFLAAVIRDLFGDGDLGVRAVAAATPGGTGAIHHAVVNFLEPGQSLLTTDYFWGPYQTITTHTGRGLATFETFDGPFGSGRFHVAAFQAALEAQLAGQGRALAVLNFPCHNPTGYSLDDAEWSAIADVVRSAGEKGPVALLVDHAYARFGTESSQDWLRHAGRILETATLLVAWTASKSFAQYGARIGALVALHPEAKQREAIRAALGFSCRGTWSNCNHLGQLAITSLLVDPELRARADRERQTLIDLVRTRVDAFNREAAGAGLRYPRYEGGFFVSVWTPDAEETACSLREEGVYVVPMKGAVRVALCSTPARDVPRLVQALATGVARARRDR